MPALSFPFSLSALGHVWGEGSTVDIDDLNIDALKKKNPCNRAVLLNKPSAIVALL